MNRELLVRSGRELARPVAGAMLLTVAEVAVVLANGGDLFLDWAEPLRYLATALPVLVLVSVTLWALASALLRLSGAANPLPPRAPVGPRARRAGATAALVAAPATAVALWALSEGRRLRDVPARPLLVVLAGVSVGAIFFWVVNRLVRRARAGDRRELRAASALAAGVAVAALVADATILRRLYPALHWTLAVVAVAGALLAFATWPGRRSGFAGGRSLPAALALVLASFVTAPLAMAWLRGASNASYVVERTAPLTGKVVGLLRRAGAGGRSLGGAQPARAPGPGQEGIDLRGESVLLVTIDALRADRVGALGGDDGLTPRMDALASEGASFRRAYTPTPHTSYAIGSLHTGKYLRPALDLPDASEDHPTLADLLREAGYHTAAFYPPAVFFVDEDRFRFLADRGLGFEHRSVGFTGASARIEQVREHLSSLPGERPVFLWVHFFEPHEPYDPPPEHARGESARERYDGEVSEVDAAVGRLVELFRAQRPGGTVVLTSDHGEEHGEHGGHYHGTTLYDEQVRVPVIWSSPGAVPRGTYDVPVDLPDLATSILAAVGVPRDARMRGDDLGPVLAGHADLGPLHAFATVDDRHMVTDGRLKAICAVGDDGCRLYDLAADPRERRNLGTAQGEEVARLRGALGEHLASIPRIEAAADGDGTPEALRRVALGDPTVGAELIPLLRHRDPEVRAQAAKALALFGHASALPALARLREQDDHPAVRAEAAIATLELGDEDAVAAVRAVATGEDHPMEARRRAALALAARGDDAGTDVLLPLLGDESADDELRADAIEALAAVRSRQAVRPLVDLLGHLHLRILAADALGRIGARRAIPPLVQALEKEPYIPARAAEAEALVRLGAGRRAEALVNRWLGAPTPLPDGVLRLLELGALEWPKGSGADLRTGHRVRGGTWECDDSGCRVGDDAVIELPTVSAPRGPARAILRVVAGADGETVVLAGHEHALRRGPQEIAIDLPPSRRPRHLPVSARGDVRLVAIAVVPAVPEP